MAKLIIGKRYRLNDRGDIAIGEYIGTEGGFECCVCGKGCKAHCFNIYHDSEGYDYETWGYGNNHLPKIEAID